MCVCVFRYLTTNVQLQKNTTHDEQNKNEHITYTRFYYISNSFSIVRRTINYWGILEVNLIDSSIYSLVLINKYHAHKKKGRGGMIAPGMRLISVCMWVLNQSFFLVKHKLLVRQ